MKHKAFEELEVIFETDGSTLLDIAAWRDKWFVEVEKNHALHEQALDYLSDAEQEQREDLENTIKKTLWSEMLIDSRPCLDFKKFKSHYGEIHRYKIIALKNDS